MNRFYLGFLLATLALFSTAKADLSLTEENQPDVLIQNLQGIILCGEGSELELSEEAYRSDLVTYVNLDLPGAWESLRRQLSFFLNHSATQETLLSIKQIIVDHFALAQRPFVVVNIPPQDVTAGVVKVSVQESVLGNVLVEGNRWTSTERLRQYIRIQPGNPLDQSRLIQDVSFINRNPFRRVDLIFAPGTKVGTTDLILATKDRRPLRVYGGVDNTGVEPVGECRWYTGFNWGNAFGLDHILSYQFTSSFSMHKFHAHTAEYTALLSWGHVLKIYGGYSEVHPPISGGFLKNDGWSMQTSGRYVVPLRIYRYLEHAITAGGDFKRSNNTFEFSDDFPLFGKNVNLTQLVVEYNGNYERNSFRFDFDGEIYWSPGRWLADQTNADYSSLRPGAVNQWVYFRGSFRYLQRMPASFSFTLLAAGQVSSQPLLPSEQYGLGGYDTVRGYEQRELNMDNAALVSMEFRSPGLPITRWIKPSSKVADALQFLAFFDAGWGSNIVTIPGTDKSDYLIGTGPGLRYTLEPYLTGRLDWGIRLHNNQNLPGGRGMVHFSLTVSI